MTRESAAIRAAIGADDVTPMFRSETHDQGITWAGHEVAHISALRDHLTGRTVIGTFANSPSHPLTLIFWGVDTDGTLIFQDALEDRPRWNCEPWRVLLTQKGTESPVSAKRHLLSVLSVEERLDMVDAAWLAGGA